jgi:DNA-binding PadR family transcriptional regulator
MKHIDRSLTNAELSILSLIVERDMHGYEIESLIQERGMRNWTEIGFSSIYHILGALENAALIRSHAMPAPGRGPARKVYEVTTEGRERYEREVLAALGTAVRPYPGFLQGLAALPLLDPIKAAEAMASYRRGLAARLQEVEQKDSPGLPFHVAAMFSYSKAMIRAESEWVAAFETSLREKAINGGEL